jgi:hypothetical protein
VLGPLLPTLIALGLVLVVRRLDFRPLAALGLLGGVLLFAIAGAIGGATGGFFRYYIVTIPLVFLLAGCLAATSRMAGLLAVLLVVPGLLTTANTMTNAKYATEEAIQLSPVLHPGTKAAQQTSGGYFQSSEVSRYIDHLHLPHGAVIVDNFEPCVPLIILQAHDPQVYVIPNDQDFKRDLQDPSTWHIRYVLAAPTGGLSSIDAINRAFPSLYYDGGGFSTQAHEFNLQLCPAFRLFKINGPTR